MPSVRSSKASIKLTLVFFLALLVFSIILPSLPPVFAQSVGSSVQDQQQGRPLITITQPSYCTSTVTAGKTIVEGMASSAYGVKKVELFAHTYPFNNHYPFQLAEPISEGNWSSWSISLDVQSTGQNRILARVVDNRDNENWAEVIVNVIAASTANTSGSSSLQNNTVSATSASSSSPSAEEKIGDSSGSDNTTTTKKRIAFVEPTFTEAAYNEDGFYNFYFKYNDVQEGIPITTDLNYMTGEIPRDIDATYFAPLVEHVKKFAPDATVSIIRDQDVHSGILFERDGSIAYDVLLLLHNEYVTQQEYDYFKNFVKNGGTIIFLNANIFYAEVIYDEDTCVVTLVKGHDWEFDGRSVRKSVAERYFEENKEWVGSNFVVRDIRDPVEFENNPFGYKHFEENYVNNPNVDVLLDYKATIIDPSAEDGKKEDNSLLVLRGVLNDLFDLEDGDYLDESHKDSQPKQIATYELQYGSGKVLMLGIYGQNLANNTKFLNYFDNIILTRAIGVPYTLTVASDEDNNSHSFVVYWKMNSGKVLEMTLDRESKKLDLYLERYSNYTHNDDALIIVLPKALIDTDEKARFTVLINNATSNYEQVADDVERAVIVPLSDSPNKIEIYGSRVLPEFLGLIPTTMYFATAILLAFIIVRGSSRFKMPSSRR